MWMDVIDEMILRSTYCTQTTAISVHRRALAAKQGDSSMVIMTNVIMVIAIIIIMIIIMVIVMIIIIKASKA